MPWLLKRTVSVGIDEAYADLKAALVEKGCIIISEEPPKQMLVKQGSLWGMSPGTAKKTIAINFAPVDSGTQVTCSSQPKFRLEKPHNSRLRLGGCVGRFMSVDNV